MNKYQEALDKLVKHSCPERTSCNECSMKKSCNRIAKDWIDTLQELVDKETSKKPKFNKQLDIVGCPACGFCDMMWGTFIKSERCPKCGQVMDWSNEE